MAKIPNLPTIADPIGNELVVVADPADQNRTKGVPINKLASAAVAPAVAIAQAAANSLSGGLAAVQQWGPATYQVTTGAYYNRTGTKTASVTYKYALCVLTGGEQLRATATLGGAVMVMACYFSNADATGFLGYQSMGDSKTHTAEPLVIPAGTKSVVISGIASQPLTIEIVSFIKGSELASQSRSAYRSASRATLQSDGVISADYGNIAVVQGNAAQGDSPQHQYIRGGMLYPTTNGWGLVHRPDLPASAFGIFTSLDEDVTGAQALADLFPAVIKDTQGTGSEDYVALPASGLWALRAMDQPLLHYADLTAGLTLEVDCAHIPMGKRFTFVTRPETHNGRMILDAGFGYTWLDTGTRFLSVPTGVRLTAVRMTTSTFVVVGTSGAAFTGVAQDAYAPIVRAASAVVIGQSLMQQGYGRGASHGAFVNRLAALGGPSSMHIVNAAYGGSGICERDVEPGDQNYWVDMTDPANPKDGPLMIAAKAVIQARGGDMSQPAISFIMDDHGQQSSGYIDSPQAPNPNFTKAMYKTAMAYKWAGVRAAAGNANLKIGLQPLGRRVAVLSTNTGRMQVVREAQWELIVSDPNAFLLGETWDLTLRDTIHPDDWGYGIAGSRAADTIARVIYGITAGVVDHPVISSATVDAVRNTIDVVIRTAAKGDRIFRVSNPTGFQVYAANGGEIVVQRAHWVGVNSADPNYFYVTLRLFCTFNPTGGTLLHVRDYCPGFDPVRAIRTWKDHGAKSLRPAKIAL